MKRQFPITKLKRHPSYARLKLSASVAVLICAAVMRANSSEASDCYNLFPSAASLRAITYGNGEFVATGLGGTIFTSMDAVTWVQQNSATSDDLYSVAFGNGQFVAVGPGCGIDACVGTIVSSADGINWIQRKVPAGIWGLNAVTYGDGRFMAVSGSGNVAVSTDGSNWVQYSTGIQNSLTGITFGGGQFVAVSDGARIQTSSDGRTWISQRSGATGDLRGVAYGGGKFVALSFSSLLPQGSAILSSTNAIDWTKEWTGTENQGNELIGVGYANGVWVVVGFGINSITRESGTTILTSTDAKNWIERSSGIVGSRRGVFLAAVAYGTGQFVAVGDRGTILTSPDAIHWTVQQAGGPPQLGDATNNQNSFVAVGNSPLENWSVRYRLGQAETLQVSAYGNGQFVAVGYGISRTSSDGINWLLHQSGIPNGLNGLTFGNGVFVGVNAGGTVHLSTNGVEWLSKQTEAGDLFGVGFGNGLFVAVGSASGSHGAIFTSSDGAEWVRRESGTSNELDAVVYGNGKFVMVGPHISLTSSDGVNWEQRTTESYSYRVAYGNGRFVAVDLYNNAVSSADGVNWTRTDVRLRAIAFGNGQYAGAEESGEIVTSLDGLNWARHEVGAPNVNSFSFGPGQIIAVGAGGSILSSTDGNLWVLRQPATPTVFAGIGYGNEQFVAVGEYGAIFTSTDGLNWIQRESGTQYALSGVAYGHAEFVVVGGGICLGCSRGRSTILTSTDAVTWVTRPSNTEYALVSVAYGNGQFVAVGGSSTDTSSFGAILTSGDGISWVPRSSGAQNYFSSVAYGDGKFVAVGYGPTRATSVDGTNWVVCETPAENALNSVTYGNGSFVAVGGRYIDPFFNYSASVSAMIRLAQGTWTGQDPGTTNVLLSIAYGDGQFVALGGKSTIVSSGDGINWMRRHFTESDSLRWGPSGVAYGNGQFIAVANNTILGSGQRGPPVGPLGLWIDAGFTNAATGYSVSFAAWHTNTVRTTVWDFGDGTVLTNTPTVTHTWTTPGNYNVRLTGYSDTYPAGETVSLAFTVQQPVYYVNESSTNPLLPYSSWQTASVSIQGAVGAGNGPGRLVLVTNGVYKVGTHLGPSGLNRITLTNQVIVQSVNGPSATVIEGASGIRCAYVGNGAVLSGFTLTKGNSVGEWPAGTGGGALGDTFGVLSNCVLVANSSEGNGGGVDSCTLYNCTLTENSAQSNGGGAYQSTLHYSVLDKNISHNNGGGADGSVLYNCKLTGNEALGEGGWGGGSSFSTLFNCILTSNSAGQYGGGALGGVLYNCTLVGNSARSVGGGVYGDTNFPTSLQNGIVLFNDAPAGTNYSGGSFSYSCTMPPAPGPGNIAENPLFANMSALDLHLRAGSPCIDTGTNLLALINSDYDGRLRPQDGNGDGIATFDMGAYEFDFSRTRAAFITVQQTPSGLSVEWNDNGKGMKLQRASALTNPVWQDVAGSELVNRLTLPLEGPTEFFRLYSF